MTAIIDRKDWLTGQEVDDHW